MQPKKILAICYSQTGQLSQIAHQVLMPLQADNRVDVHVEHLKPAKPYPFPWPFFRFFDAFPESAHLIAPELLPLSLSADNDFDLVIIFYQVWFLAPSLPITGFMKHPLAAKLLKDKPVITIIGCRNMWIMAQEKMKKMLTDVGANLVDNAVLMDKANMAATFITTPRWFLTGKKDAFWGLPAAGIPQRDINRSSRFGNAICDALANNAHTSPMLTGLEAVQANPKIIVSEKAGTRGFFIWGKLIRAIGQPGSWLRFPILALYVVFLATLILTVVPISLTIQALVRPLLKNKLSALKEKLEQPSGSGSERMHLYDK